MHFRVPEAASTCPLPVTTVIVENLDLLKLLICTKRHKLPSDFKN